MIDHQFDAVQAVGFNEEASGYASVVNRVVSATVGILDHHAISFDKESLSSKISTLKIVRRDNQSHEYSPEDNTLFLSTCNREGAQYSDEEMIIFTTHELMHLISNNKIGKDYIGFDEFFTEYLTSLVVSNIGGINLETYYRHNTNGYFGNGHDISFISSLVARNGFKNILSSYVDSSVGTIEATVGKDTLVAMNEYFTYYDQLAEHHKVSYRQLNTMLLTPSLESQQKNINDLYDKVHQSISL